MFTKIDTKLLDQAQKGADWFTDTYGRGPYWIASTAALVSLGFVVAGVMLERAGRFDGFDIFYTLLILSVSVFFHIQDKTMRGATTRTMNPWKITVVGKLNRGLSLASVALGTFSVLMLAGSPGFPGLLCDMLRDAAWASAMYFASCDTKPPAPKPVEMPAAVPEAA